MTERQFFLWFVEKLPSFDPAWPDKVRQAWMDCFMRLWRWGYRLDVESAIDRFVEGEIDEHTDRD